MVADHYGKLGFECAYRAEDGSRSDWRLDLNGGYSPKNTHIKERCMPDLLSQLRPIFQDVMDNPGLIDHPGVECPDGRRLGFAGPYQSHHGDRVRVQNQVRSRRAGRTQECGRHDRIDGTETGAFMIAGWRGDAEVTERALKVLPLE